MSSRIDRARRRALRPAPPGPKSVCRAALVAFERPKCELIPQPRQECRVFCVRALRRSGRVQAHRSFVRVIPATSLIFFWRRSATCSGYTGRLFLRHLLLRNRGLIQLMVQIVDDRLQRLDGCLIAAQGFELREQFVGSRPSATNCSFTRSRLAMFEDHFPAQFLGLGGVMHFGRRP